MNRYIIFLVTENLKCKDAFDKSVQSVLMNADTRHSVLVNIDATFAACVTAYTTEKRNPKGVEAKWCQVHTENELQFFISETKACTEYCKPDIEDLANVVHSLADTLPRLGCLVDVFWCLPTLNDFCGYSPLYGALKRLQQWNSATITVISLDMQPTPDSASPLLMSWIESLRAYVVKLEMNQRQFAVWHGCVLITGSQQSVKLPGFRLECMSTCDIHQSSSAHLFGENEPTCRKKSALVLSPVMSFVAEVDYNDVPPFYLTGHCFWLNLSSASRYLNRSRQFLHRLTATSDLCYILRLSYGSSWREVDCRPASKKHGKSMPWKELLKESIAYIYDNPCSVELHGNIANFHFLVRAIHNDASNSDAAAYNFVAQRLRGIAEINGLMVESLCRGVTKMDDDTSILSGDGITCFPLASDRWLSDLPHISTNGLPQVYTGLSHIQHHLTASDNNCDSIDAAVVFKELAALRAQSLHEFISQGLIQKDNSQSSEINHICVKNLLPEYMQDPYLQPERQMLVWKAYDSTANDGIQSAANDTLGKLSPPTKRKAILLNAVEFVKFFNADGTAAKPCSGKVLLKKPSSRLFKYDDSVDRDSRQLHLARWPTCLASHFHDVYYNIGNAEDIERQCIRRKSRLESTETMSTCNISESNLSPKSRQSLMLPVTERGSGGRCRPAVRRVMYANSPCSSAKKPKIARLNNHSHSQERSARNSEEGKVVKRTTIGGGKSVEPRSVRNRRKMEDVVHDALRVHGVSACDSLYEACFKRLCTVTETFVKDLPTSRGLREEMQKIAEQYVEHTIEFEKNCQRRLSSA